MLYFEKNCLQNYQSDFTSHYVRRYVDDIFVLFISLEDFEVFLSFLIDQHANLSLTIGNHNQNQYRILFLDAQIIREDKKTYH